MSKKNREKNVFFSNATAFVLIYAALFLSFASIIDGVKNKSRLHSVQRQYEALVRTTSGRVDSAYVCYGADAKKQLETLLVPSH